MPKLPLSESWFDKVEKSQLGIREIVTDIHAWLDANRAALEPILK
ncbi:hypothetical protein [Spirosoma aureum]|nr:hypothetical protein [Spirosoma aureum]